ncbi:MAG: hypothetical protein V3R67_03870 [Thermodesulfobacteriota bacterium]
MPICLSESANYSPSEPDEPAEENSEKQTQPTSKKKKKLLDERIFDEHKDLFKY